MKRTAVVYVHGKGGSAGEAEHYRPLFPDCQVLGLDYHGSTPWEAGAQLRRQIEALSERFDELLLIANSIGAFFTMHAGVDHLIQRAYFISPVVDMERLILDLMRRAHVTEQELRDRRSISTDSGEKLSWAYLCWVREHPIRWRVPTRILYGGRDQLTSPETISAFAQAHGACLRVMEEGEHWFHTPEQMRFLDRWIAEAGCGSGDALPTADPAESQPEKKGANPMTDTSSGRTPPSMDAWLREAKASCDAARVGMYLVHNGVVRADARAMVREGNPDARPVRGMCFSSDGQKVRQVVKETLELPGIFCARVWLNEGVLQVGEDLMYVLVGGDIRPHVVDALQFLVDRLKGECVTEREFYD